MLGAIVVAETRSGSRSSARPARAGRPTHVHSHASAALTPPLASPLAPPPLPLCSQTKSSAVADRLALAAELLADSQWQQKYKDFVRLSAVPSANRPALLNGNAPEISNAN